MISALLALISYVIVIFVGLTCLAVEEKMQMLISTFTKKIHFCTFFADSFVNVFYSALLQIVWEQIFHFQTILGRKCDWKRDMLRKKLFFCHFKVIQGQSRSFEFIIFFCIPSGYHVVKNDENMKMSYNYMPTYALNLAIWAHLAPQCWYFHVTMLHA